MGSGIGSLEIARSGLFVNERGLNVIGHNIANVNTQGYVRQQAVIADAPPAREYGNYDIGLGADIQQTRQIRNAFLDNIYRQENTTLGYWQARNKTFEDVQAVLGEPMEDGLQSTLNEFWDSWQELSKDPSSLTVRAIVRQRGENLAKYINHMGSQISKLQSDLDSEIAVRVNEVNTITSQIAELNSKIISAEVRGETANDYRDQRNLLVDKLTMLAGAEVTEQQDGQYLVNVNGYFLVQKGTSTKLKVEKLNADDAYMTPMLEGSNIVLPLTNGTIKGLLDSRGQESLLTPVPSGTTVSTDYTGPVLSQIKASLNALTKALFDGVNKLHKAGKTMNAQTGYAAEDFFTLADPGKPLTMENLRVNSNFTNLNNIAAGATTDKGDNSVALQISKLRSDPMLSDDTGILSLDGYYQSIINNIGNAGAEASSIMQNQQRLVQSSDDSRQSIMGVSMDEEMANMLKFKYAYNASAKTISVIDEMLETIINKIGIGGR